MQHSSWHALIKEQLPEGYFGKINQFMEQVYAQGTVYPPKEKVFQALLTTPLEEVKVVISVRHTVKVIRNHPLMPADIAANQALPHPTPALLYHPAVFD